MAKPGEVAAHGGATQRMHEEEEAAYSRDLLREDSPDSTGSPSCLGLHHISCNSSCPLALIIGGIMSPINRVFSSKY